MSELAEPSPHEVEVPADALGSEGHALRGDVFSILGQLAWVGLPVIAVNSTTTMMQVTDAMMVGHLGSSALAALTPPTMVLFTIQSFAYGLLAMITTFVAQSTGRGDQRLSGRYAWQGIYIGLAIGLVTLGLRPVAPILFSCFGQADQEVLSLEIAYFQTAVFAVPAAMVTLAVSNFFIGIRRNVIIIGSSLLALVTNVVINYGLIFGELGLTRLGFEGAAIGTVCATVLEALVVLTFFLVPARYRRDLGTARPWPSLTSIGQIVRVGLPAAVQVMVDVASWALILTWLVASFGTADQAATTVLIRCVQLSYLPAEGIAVAALSLVGAAVGARKPDLADRIARTAVLVVGGFMTTMGGVYYFQRVPILELFTDDAAVIATGASAMLFVALMQPFDSLNIVYSHTLHGTGDTAWSSIANVVLCGAILLGGGIGVVIWFPELGSPAVWALMACYIVALGTAMRVRWKHGRWRKIDLLDDGAGSSIPSSSEQALADRRERNEAGPTPSMPVR